MKTILLLVFLLFANTFVSAQAVAWDSTYRPDIFMPQVELFRSLPHSQEDVVFLGNSITFWANWTELLGSPNVKNRGIPGDITFGVLERLDEVIQGQPAKVFVQIGINDLARRIPDSVIVRNYARIINLIKAGSPTTLIYFQTLLPTNDTFKKLTNHYHKEEQIQKINSALKQIARQDKVEVIDLYPHFVDTTGRLKKEYTWDGVHLTLAGYTAWMEVLQKGDYINRKQ